jgi:hypothetical protein
VEPDVAVSPVNPRIAVAAAHDGRFPDGGAVAIAYAWTHDGGQHWHPSVVPQLTTAVGGAWERASDPVVAFGPDGTAYLSTLLFSATSCPTAVAVSRSTDGGRTFGPPVLAHSSQVCEYSDDKNWLVVDTSARSPHRGRLYQFWTLYNYTPGGEQLSAPQVVRWSDDRGTTWSPTVTVSEPVVDSQNSQPLLHPDGAITDLYLKYPPGSPGEEPEHGQAADRPGYHQPQLQLAPSVQPSPSGEPEPSLPVLVARTSRDGGRTWGPEVTVTAEVGAGPEGIRCCLPSGTADPRTGRLYAVWNAPGDRWVLLSTSTDGRHWSAPRRVDATRPGTRVVNADVSALAGRVIVSAGTLDASGRYVQQQVTVSADRGAHFGRPLPVGPPSDTRYAAIAGGIFPGDYIGTAAGPGYVYAVWCRSSRPPDPAATYHQTLYAAVLRP